MSEEAILIEGCQDGLCFQREMLEGFSPSYMVSEHSQKYKETSSLVI
jgi:hypothetical protein